MVGTDDAPLPLMAMPIARLLRWAARIKRTCAMTSADDPASEFEHSVRRLPVRHDALNAAIADRICAYSVATKLWKRSAASSECCAISRRLNSCARVVVCKGVHPLRVMHRQTGCKCSDWPVARVADAALLASHRPQ